MIVGKYYCFDLQSTLDITESNDANGEAAGVFEFEHIRIPVKIHYHYKNNYGRVINLCFAGSRDDPNEYVGGAGLITYNEIPNLLLAGGYATNIDAREFKGDYTNQNNMT